MSELSKAPDEMHIDAHGPIALEASSRCVAHEMRDEGSVEVRLGNAGYIEHLFGKMLVRIGENRSEPIDYFGWNGHRFPRSCNPRIDEFRFDTFLIVPALSGARCAKTAAR